jgi:parvulin-like peptidyl-prolyl isomerase
MFRRSGALAVASVAAMLAWQVVGTARAQQSPAPPAEREVTFRLIVVSTETAARELVERLRRGADADAIAAAESIDPSAARGGLIGPVVLAELRPELRDAMAG